MFPSHQNNELSSQISFTPYQENTIPQDLKAIDDPSENHSMGKSRQRNPCSSHNKDENTDEISAKRNVHRDIEKRRRQEMTTLYTSLRNLLPLEYIKVINSLFSSFNFYFLFMLDNYSLLSLLANIFWVS